MDDNDDVLHRSKTQSNRSGHPARAAPSGNIGIRRGLYMIARVFSSLTAASGK
jgi:hypothetical protein